MTQQEISKDLTIVLNEFIFRKYRFARDEVQQLTHGISIREYVALYVMKRNQEQDKVYDGRIYLQDLVDQLKIPMRVASSMVKDLSERGAVSWSYDGDGSEGTYVIITESGKEMLEEQESLLNEFYSDVIEEFGYDNLLELLKLMRKMDAIINSEFVKLEGYDELF